MTPIENVEQERNFNFSLHTTYGLGGIAEVAYFPKNFEEVRCVFDYLRRTRKKYVILGGGSNVLASDKFYDGAIISTKNLKHIEVSDGKIICGSGVTVADFLKFCIKSGVGGYEYLAGIPATLGGLTYMNGGVPERHIGDDIINVWVFDGEIRKLAQENCQFGNKYSTMRDINCCILQVQLPFTRADGDIVRQNINKRMLSRGKQPKGRNCGCVFKNAGNLGAGKLIDECGLKGLTYGMAQVSNEHANFIINNGGCAQDVYNLIALVKKAVYEKTHILLEEEVVYIGEFNDFNG